jgi:hypothetical protein
VITRGFRWVGRVDEERRDILMKGYKVSDRRNEFL